MRSLTQAELDRITAAIFEDRESIIRHNPIGTEKEVLLWMLLGCLVSYLSLSEIETPCFTAKPDADTYVDAIRYILRQRKTPDFDSEPYISRLLSAD